MKLRKGHATITKSSFKKPLIVPMVSEREILIFLPLDSLRLRTLLKDIRVNAGQGLLTES